MSLSRQKPWTLADCLALDAAQPLGYELADGKVQATGGGIGARDLISPNLRMSLKARQAGTRCCAHGSDLKVATATGKASYPDAHIDCGRFHGPALTATDPVTVFELLSKSTARFDRNLKLRNCAATPSILRPG